MLPTSVFVLVLIGSSWIGQKNLKNCDQIDKNADLGHFSLFLACFWPVTAPVTVLNIPTEYIFFMVLIIVSEINKKIRNN